jgi:2-polyprenyl-6-methoxyphenol hydroxylase-like FAD-dependent oxidoreductase
MADVLIVGGGVVGMGLGMLLARDGHAVTTLERDAQPPPASEAEAWESWERKGVTQFRLPHLFLARYRQILEEELPDVVRAIEGDGALRFNPLRDAPEFLTGAPRQGDDRFEMLSGRRAVTERSVASVAEQTPGLTIRRGVAVDGLVTGPDAVSGIPHVVGVHTTDGEVIRADLVIDCAGRRSALPAWLAALGGRPLIEEVEDSGFIYLGRHYRSTDGELPVALGPGLQSYGSISVLTLPADNGTWSVTLVANSSDRALRGLKDLARWETVVRSLPTVAHWLDGAPIEDRIITMAQIHDRHRDLRPEGVPVATGVLAVADAWACTNPSVGRGASIGMLHAQTLRDTLRHCGPERPGELAEAFATATAATVEPWYRSTLSFDRHRLAEMVAFADGTVYDPGDPAFEFGAALARATERDHDVFRGFLDVVGVLERPETVLARPGLMDKVIEYGADWREAEPIGPDREALVAMANA